jgi:hypothetical protein
MLQPTSRPMIGSAIGVPSSDRNLHIDPGAEPRPVAGAAAAPALREKQHVFLDVGEVAQYWPKSQLEAPRFNNRKPIPTGFSTSHLTPARPARPAFGRRIRPKRNAIAAESPQATAAAAICARLWMRRKRASPARSSM